MFVGENHPKSILTVEIVRELRQAQKKRQQLTNKALARRFNITITAVKHVLAGKRWKHVK
jgi:transcriptional regulator with XRE-family HTH domain